MIIHPEALLNFLDALGLADTEVVAFLDDRECPECGQPLDADWETTTLQQLLEESYADDISDLEIKFKNDDGDWQKGTVVEFLITAMGYHVSG